jgi:ATP-dependent exoDNAse (exonuclease V) beta subunit
MKIRFISAGAGTGKTSRLADLLQEMLLAGHVNPGGIIATTFTNKAAVELRERVRSHLLRNGEAKLAVGIGQAYIGTVNSVCGSLLVRFAFEARLPTIQRVLDPQTAQQILQQSVDEVIEEGTLEQLLRVAHHLALDEPRHGQREEPWRTALREIVDQARANAIDPEALRSFGSINADRLLKHFPPAVGDNLDSLLADAVKEVRGGIRAAIAGGKLTKVTEKYLQCLDDTERDLRTGGMLWAQWNKLANEKPEARLQAMAQEASRRAGMHTAHPQLHADLREYLTTIFNLAASALDHFATRKREIGAVDFADQERLLLDVLDHEEVASALREDLDLLMVDEFQDTSPIQLALFLKLARLAKHVVWVGDIKQAIYGFRGGDAALMQAVLASLPGLGAEKEALRQSYRSRPPLVALVNDVFATAFEGVDASEITLDAVRDDLEAPIAVEDWWLEGSNGPARCEAVASGIAALMAEGVAVMDRTTGGARRVRLADIAVLARTNPAVQELAGVLRARGVPSSTSQAWVTGAARDRAGARLFAPAQR